MRCARPLPHHIHTHISLPAKLETSRRCACARTVYRRLEQHGARDAHGHHLANNSASSPGLITSCSLRRHPVVPCMHLPGAHVLTALHLPRLARMCLDSFLLGSPCMPLRIVLAFRTRCTAPLFSPRACVHACPHCLPLPASAAPLCPRSRAAHVLAFGTAPSHPPLLFFPAACPDPRSGS
jgi:hypothetical protein